MILVLDISNSNIVLAGMEESHALFSIRLSTDLTRTPDEYSALISFSAAGRGIDLKTTEGAIISSVVPQLTAVLREAVETVTGKIPLVVGPGVKTGLNIRIDDPGELGADFVAAAVAALSSYPLPCVTIDMGTATAIGVLDARGDYVGGAICPGIAVSRNALARGTAQLPSVSLRAPGNVISKSTVECMRSGLIYGTAAMLDGLLERIESELGMPVSAVATGDFAASIVPHCQRKITVDEELLLRGLWRIYIKNRRER